MLKLYVRGILAPYTHRFTITRALIKICILKPSDDLSCACYLLFSF